MKNFILILLLTLCQNTFAQDWSRQAELPGGDEEMSPQHRGNILNLHEQQWLEAQERGRRHVFHYPASVTPLMVPWAPLNEFFTSTPNSPLRRWLHTLSKKITRIENAQDLMDWLGIQSFPSSPETQGPGPWPLPLDPREHELGMGASLIPYKNAEGLTFSCATCHSANLFGTKVVGLTNRFPRANEFFIAGKRLLKYAHPSLFQVMTGASKDDVEILRRSRYAVQFVGLKKPQTLGLDTSLAQVALSLARREQDAYATRTEKSAKAPRPNLLDTLVADSKPAVWWNVKYKTRWLSDGSIVSGNPVHTNFLWNEIGRGVDLKELERWMVENQQVIDDLTATVFASEAPAYLDFFPAATLDLPAAQRGQRIFEASCTRCHGEYQKAWDQADAHLLPLAERVKTTAVWYHKKTPVVDVGTDPGRHQGMAAFADDLNRLAISQKLKTVVEVQTGYVPPPLVGIWARWPYFHNNSAPNLCAVLTAGKDRPKSYVAGEALDQATDFDAECVGYPRVTPAHWKNKAEFVYDTRRPGMGNQGHDEGIFLRDGKELLTAAEKKDLIEFLKTL